MEFAIKIAEKIIKITPLFSETKGFFHGYLINDTIPDFIINCSQENIAYEVSF